jgi:hypothetical protein
MLAGGNKVEKRRKRVVAAGGNGEGSGGDCGNL